MLDYLGKDNPTREVFEAVEDACQHFQRDPFKEWDIPAMDNDFKDLVMSMMKLDPRKRVTARGALAHKWFRGV